MTCFVDADEVFPNESSTENLFCAFFFPCSGWLRAARCWRATAAASSVASAVASAVAAAVACAAGSVNYPTTSTTRTTTPRRRGPGLERSRTDVGGGVRLFDLTVSLWMHVKQQTRRMSLCPFFFQWIRSLCNVHRCAWDRKWPFIFCHMLHIQKGHHSFDCSASQYVPASHAAGCRVFFFLVVFLFFFIMLQSSRSHSNPKPAHI